MIFTIIKRIEYNLKSAMYIWQDWIMCKTIQWEIVKSQKEKKIADYFQTNWIEYEYEKPLQINNKTIHPDFYLPEHNLYVEYFWLTNRKTYRKNMRFKMHQYYNNNQWFKFMALYRFDLKNINTSFRKKFLKIFWHELITKNDKICPNCKTKLIKRKGRFWIFYWCTHYPTCKYTEKIEKITKKTSKEIEDTLSDKLNFFKKKTWFELSEIMSAQTIDKILKEKPKTKFQLFKIWSNFQQVQIYWDILIKIIK